MLCYLSGTVYQFHATMITPTGIHIIMLQQMLTASHDLFTVVRNMFKKKAIVVCVNNIIYFLYIYILHCYVIVRWICSLTMFFSSISKSCFLSLHIFMSDRKVCTLKFHFISKYSDNYRITGVQNAHLHWSFKFWVKKLFLLLLLLFF